jgi:predicted transcriptional regulator
MTSGDHVADSSLDSMLDVLSNRYRRRLLVALLEHNPQEDDDPQVPDDVSHPDEDLEELMISMRHSHLPKLADAGFIEWDQEMNSVRRGPKFEEIRPLLELMANHADELPDDWL